MISFVAQVGFGNLVAYHDKHGFQHVVNTSLGHVLGSKAVGKAVEQPKNNQCSNQNQNFEFSELEVTNPGDVKARKRDADAF